MVVDDAPEAQPRSSLAPPLQPPSAPTVHQQRTNGAPTAHQLNPSPSTSAPASRPLYCYIGSEEFAYAGAGVDDEGYDYASDKDAGLDGEGTFLFV